MLDESNTVSKIAITISHPTLLAQARGESRKKKKDGGKPRGGGDTPYIGLSGEAPPKGVPFFRLQVYKRVRISYEKVGKSVL